jgi:polyphosphate kinase
MDKKLSPDGALKKPLISASDLSTADAEARRKARVPYMQNRELSWLTFDERCLDQGADESVPLLERLQFVSIFWSNLQEFFMVRVGSLTDLSLLKKVIIDTKSNMTPQEQLQAIYARCHELYPVEEQIYQNVRAGLAEKGVRRLEWDQLTGDQREYATTYLKANVLPFLTPQIINARHPFPHLENGDLYIIVRLTEEKDKKAKESRKKAKDVGAEGVTLGIVPLPGNASRVVKLPGEGFNFILLEDLLEANLQEIYSMYTIKHTNVICVTRNADLDATETADEGEEDYREHMKKILKKRARLAPVRLESKRRLSDTIAGFLLPRLNLEPYQCYVTSVPLDMGYAFALSGMVDPVLRAKLTSEPFAPAWPAEIKRTKRVIEQVQEHDVLLSYPYESMDPFVQMLREAAADPRRRVDQDHPLPPGEPLAPGRGPDRRRRSRQGGHGPLRAARPLRRKQQHPVVAALRGSRRQRHLRLPRLQGPQQDLLHHAPDRKRPAAHHPAGHRQLQREDRQALHRLQLHHHR